jgi:predicted nucleic acid-binding protein
MVVLDTNVLSALMNVRPEARVLAWLDRQVNMAVWTSVVSIFELRRGVDGMPEGRKRRDLQVRMERILEDVLADRILPVDRESADVAGQLWAQRIRRGVPVSVEDTLIAGVVLARGATLATRNTRHFPEVPVVNPWD